MTVFRCDSMVRVLRKVWPALILVLLVHSHLLGAPADHTASELIGQWEGTSVCTDRVVAPACHDEVVVYDFTAGASPDTVHWKADKIVDGKRQPMGEFDLTYDRDDACWKAEFKSSRAHFVWCVTATGSQLNGVGWGMPGKKVVRRIDAHRK